MENSSASRQSLFKRQPGVVLRMQAKPGLGDALFNLATDLHDTTDPDGPVDWVLCRVDGEPDTLWAFEFYRDDASFTRHYSNPLLDEGHDQVLGLLADMPMRVNVHIASSNTTGQP